MNTLNQFDWQFASLLALLGCGVVSIGTLVGGAAYYGWSL